MLAFGPAIGPNRTGRAGPNNNTTRISTLIDILALVNFADPIKLIGEENLVVLSFGPARSGRFGPIAGLNATTTPNFTKNSFRSFVKFLY